jgi:hypothetical protein
VAIPPRIHHKLDAEVIWGRFFFYAEACFVAALVIAAAADVPEFVRATATKLQEKT